MVVLVGVRMATFRPDKQRYDKQKPKTKRMKCRILSCGGAKKSPFGGFSPGAFSPRKHAYTTWQKSATILLCLHPA